MTSADPPILAAVVDAVHSATLEQLPLPDVPLRSRVLRRLPAGTHVTLADVRDAALHLRVVGLVRRDGDGWAPGLLSPEDAPVEPRHERLFWDARRRAGGGTPVSVRARERQRDLGNVPPDERARLAAAFGGVLRLERGHRRVEDIAAVADMNAATVRRLEVGIRRPTTSSVWRLAKALRPKGTLRDVVALDERLRQAAGDSLRHVQRRPHRRRERVRAELRAAAGDGAVVGDHGESLGSIIAAELGRRFGAG